MWKPIAAAAVLLALTTQSAAADSGSTLQLTAPATAKNGRAVGVTATGANPLGTDRAVTIVGLPLLVVPACPADAVTAEALSRRTESDGGSSAITWQTLPEDFRGDGIILDVEPSGAYTLQVAWWAWGTGRFLICGYVTEPDHTSRVTYATASAPITIFSANGTNRPTPLDPPTLTRAGGRLSCHRGRWTPTPTRFAYAWTVDGRRKRGAGVRTLRITKALRGRSVRCAVTAFTGHIPGQIHASSKTVFTPAIRVDG